MYKVCLNNLNQIIGFDLKNSISYINLFNINNVSKTITEYKEFPVMDSLGRKLYLKHNNESDVTEETYIIDNSDKFSYTLKTQNVLYQREILLIDNVDKFTMDDIILEKKKQLIDEFKCKDCILYELFDNNLVFNTHMGNNIIKINRETISNKLLLDNNKKISIYCESNNDLEISVSNNKKNWINIKGNEFIDYNKKNIYIKINSIKESDIYCIAILIN